MVQSFNWPAVKQAFGALFSLEKLHPKLTVKNLNEIDWERLKGRGIKAVCLDKDNTITAPYSPNIHSDIKESFRECKRVYVGRVAVFSNSYGAADYDPEFKLADAFERENEIAVIRHSSKKPDGIKHVLKSFDGLRPDEIAFVGDRLLTDILMANEAGIFSILLREPLTTKGDNYPALFIRKLEHGLLSLKSTGK